MFKLINKDIIKDLIRYEIRIYLTKAGMTDQQTHIEEVMEIAENNGTVYTLPYFIQMLNDEFLDIEEYFVRVVLFKDGIFIEEIEGEDYNSCAY